MLGDCMLGLEFIRTTFGDTTITLGEKLGISNVNISQWENGKKPIPEKRLDELHLLYDVPKGYFSKELSRLEQLIVEWVKIHKEWKASFHEYEAPIKFNSEGEPIEYTVFKDCDRGLTVKLKEIEADVKIEKVIEEIRNVIKSKYTVSDDSYDEFDYVNDKERNTDLVHKFTKIMKESDINFLEQILLAIEMFNDDSWGQNPKLDRNGLTGRILKTITEWKDEEKKRQEAEYQEYKELFGLDDEEND